MTMEPLTPERRRQQTRDYLLRAAEQVFAERGFHGASLDEVASVAGFTKGAVYSNFKNKEDLFLALLESRYEHEMKVLRETLETPDDPPEAHFGDFVALMREQDDSGGWDRLYLEFCLYATRHPAAREKLAAFRRQDLNSVAEIIRTERQRLSIDATEPAEHAAGFAIALTRGLSIMRMIDDELVTDAFLEDFMVLLFRALTSTSEPIPPGGPGAT
jgi:AcrR family transcriptional regulator